MYMKMTLMSFDRLISKKRKMWDIKEILKVLTSKLKGKHCTAAGLLMVPFRRVWQIIAFGMKIKQLLLYLKI